MAEDLGETMRRFRATHPGRTFSDGRLCWPYLVGGSGEETVLLLPGALGRGETSFQYVAALEARYRVIAPSYPPGADTIAALADGVASLVAAQGAERAHVVGGSFGGIVAQGLLRRHPERVAGLILSDTTPPLPGRLNSLRFRAALLSRLPQRSIRALLTIGIGQYLRNMPPNERRFWRAHFAEHIAALTKAEVLDRARAWIDFDRHYTAPPNPKRDVLILQAADDRMVSPGQHAALCALYPCATRHAIRGGGHAASLSRAGEYIEAIRGFFEALTPFPSPLLPAFAGGEGCLEHGPTAAAPGAAPTGIPPVEGLPMGCLTPAERVAG